MADQDQTLRLLIQLGVQGEQDALRALDLLKKTREEGAGQAEGKGAGERINLRGFRREARDIMELGDVATKQFPLINAALGKYRYEITMAAYEAAQKFPAMAESIGKIALVATGAVVIFQHFSESIKRANEEMDKLAEEAARPMTRRLEAQREETVRLAVATDGLAAKIAEAGAKELTFAERLSESTAKQKAATENRNTVLGAGHAAALAALEYYHTKGMISEVQFVEQKLELEKEFQRRKRAIDEAAEDADLAARKAMMQKAREDVEQRKAAAFAAAGRESEAALALAGIPREDDLKERMKQAQAALEKWKAESKDRGFAKDLEAIGMGSTAEAVASARFGAMGHDWLRVPKNRELLTGVVDEFRSLLNEIQQAKREYDAAPKRRQVAEVAAARARRGAEAAESAVMEGEGFLASTGRGLEMDAARIAAGRRARDQAERLGDLEGTFKAATSLEHTLTGVKDSMLKSAETTGKIPEMLLRQSQALERALKAMSDRIDKIDSRARNQQLPGS